MKSDGATNRIDEARAYIVLAHRSLMLLEEALNLVESNVGHPQSSRVPALDRAARAALGVDIAADELARATCWLTREYREREEQRASMSRPNPGQSAEKSGGVAASPAHPGRRVAGDAA